MTMYVLTTVSSSCSLIAQKVSALVTVQFNSIQSHFIYLTKGNFVEMGSMNQIHNNQNNKKNIVKELR